MKVLAITKTGAEFFYNYKSAHEVSNASAERIKTVLNEHNFLLKDGETWYVYDVDQYDNAYDYAQYQKFTLRKGVVKRKYDHYLHY